MSEFHSIGISRVPYINNQYFVSAAGLPAFIQFFFPHIVAFNGCMHLVFQRQVMVGWLKVITNSFSNHTYSLRGKVGSLRWRIKYVRLPEIPLARENDL